LNECKEACLQECLSDFNRFKMSALLRGARVFSNETENNASVKQEMTTNINVKLHPEQKRPINQIIQPPSVCYPNINDVNFIPPTEQDSVTPISAPLNPIPPTPPFQYHFPACNQPQIVPRSANINADSEKHELESKVRVLEALLGIYESAPILIKGCLIVSQKKLIEIIQILTGCEKVELLTDDFSAGCCANEISNIVTISKIFVADETGNRSEFKVAFNPEYSLLLRHGLNLKLVRVE
jgi:hypothetical protein